MAPPGGKQGKAHPKCLSLSLLFLLPRLPPSKLGGGLEKQLDGVAGAGREKGGFGASGAGGGVQGACGNGVLGLLALSAMPFPGT